jgi:phosphoglycolate phosphatase-like HAD superfamily hydrolase
MTNTNTQRLAIFDLDNTLIDSDKKLEADFIGAMHRLGVKVTPEEARAGGKSWYDFASKYGYSKEQFDKAFDQRKSWEASLNDGEVPIFEDTVPCLERLAAGGVKLGLLSKSIPEYTEMKLKHFGLRGYFHGVETVHPKIPSKIEGAMSLINKILPYWNNTDFAFIGDRPDDITIEKEVWQRQYASDNELFPVYTSTQGILLNRKGAQVPQEISGNKGYSVVKGLNEVPPLILGAENAR